MTEQEIIHQALGRLRQQTFFKVEWLPATQKTKAGDGYIILHINNKKLKFTITVKKEIRSHQLVQIEELHLRYPNLLVVAMHIFPKVKEALRTRNIAYLEANGNLYFHADNHLVWIDTNKPLPAEDKPASRAFTKTGLKVVYQFLLDENWLNTPYRQIEEHTGVAIANITNVIAGLKQGGFVLPVAKNQYKLTDKKQLLEKWVAAYERRLKPTLQVGRFRFLKEEDFLNWKELPLQTGKTMWGSEPAADLLTGYLHPAELTLYTTETRNELIKNYRLIPDDNGNVKAYNKFWKHDDAAGNIVHPLLVYTDLMNTGDRRCLETAQKIFDASLQHQF
ncbi:MAG TPA: type IV toxin-antitoxin system AbiEi family antitoxin [Agriterribacter sp.]|nr:type IV toxin-antitoxin system AbiEi family antitoxin [Agriterribacter sp.]HRQ48927.1 type IV toxin-antitoxin system AbiEi family antitoxin [Agriterribacter sp.]